MRIAISAVLTFVCWNALVALGQPAEQTQPKRTPVRYMSEESLAKLVNTNMSKQQVTERFGNPDMTSPLEGGFHRWDFSFSPDESSGPRRSIAAGVTVYWKEDKMIRWAPQYSITGGKNPEEFMRRIEPRVYGPISAGRFSITVSDEKSFQALRDSFVGLLQE